jgi:SAM-dependent methyltransferase
MAARQVGSSGRVIGVDMTPEMLVKAERNRAAVGLDNVEFRRGFIESLPVEDGVVDVILSNCVINLSPDKAAVFREAYRALRPGGRLAVSDMVTRGRFTPEERANASAWADCVTGAEDVAVYAAAMRDAGFTDVSIVDKAEPEVELADLPPESGPARLFSARVTAIKR